MTWREEWEELTGKCAPNCSLTQNRFHPVVLAMDRHVREVEDELSRAEQHAKKMAEEYNVLAKKYHEQRGRAEQAEAQLCRAREAWAILTGERLKYVEAWPTSKLRANDAMEAALSSIAPCPHEAKVKEAEGKLDAVVISHDEVVRANIVLEAKVARLEKGLKDVEALINESSGVAGLHLNGEIAEWGDLRTGGVYEEWLRDFDAALAAKEGK